MKACDNCIFNQTINYKGPLNDHLIFCSKFGCPMDINDINDDSDCRQEKERRKTKREALLGELAKEDLQVLVLAYTYAKNIQMYGEDVTEEWQTATQNASALEKAYNKGYYDALEQISRVKEVDNNDKNNM